MAYFSSEQVALLSDRTVRFALLAKMDFKSGTKYVWDGEYPLTVDGNVYQPLHGIATIEGLGQNSGTDSAQITITVAGIPNQTPDFLNIVLNETAEASQQLITIYMQFFDQEWQLVGSPLAIWFGFMQPPRISRASVSDDSGQQQSVTLTAENVFYNRSRPPRGRYTDRDQQLRYPGDTFFQFVPTLLNFSTTYPDY